MASGGGKAYEVGVRALGAFSGGLDGAVAATLLVDQGVEVELVTFLSPFFSSESGRTAAKEMGLAWREVDFSQDIIEILKDPPSGFGKNCNPCIDCHAGMFRRLGDIACNEGFHFIFSGEVLGQRPMSQNRNSLNRVSRLSGYRDILLRPLSARLLDPTEPEEKGYVHRDKLMDISGRSRKRQLSFSRERGLGIHGSGGGCMLTEPAFSIRLRVLIETPGLLTEQNAWLITAGRMFRLPGGSICLVGRSQEDNEKLELYSGGRVIMELIGLPGPTGVMVSPDPDPGDLEIMASLVALYGKVPHDDEVEVTVSGGGTITSVPALRTVAGRLMIKPE